MWWAWTEMACGELRWLLENRDHGILFRSVLQPFAGDMPSQWCHHILFYMRICMIFSSILFYKGIQQHVYLVFNCRNSLLSHAMWWNCVLKTLFFKKILQIDIVLFWRPYAIATVDLFSSCVAFNLSFVLIMMWKPWVEKDSFYWILIAFFSLGFYV
jgi:hypothetical protein